MSESVYCMKEKKKVEFATEPKYETKATSRGKKGLLTGTCNSCGGKVSKIVKAKEVD